MLLSPSSINWCEADYQVTPFIAEFGNTITGLFLCISSIIFYYKYEKKLKCNKYECIVHANELLFIIINYFIIVTIFIHPIIFITIF